MKETKVIKAEPSNLNENEIMPAAKIIASGGLCVFPTETVYGLGANALDAGAVSKIFEAKGRPQDNPLIVHIREYEQLFDLVTEVPQKAQVLAEHFWGGPLTMIFKRSESVPAVVSAGLDTVAVRLPSHPVANALIKLSGVPIAAPSANLSGKPSPTSFKHAAEDMTGRADAIIDGGNSFFGIESTVIDMTENVPTILRPGAITPADIKELIGEVYLGKGNSGAPKSPGMKYKHYAPRAPLYIVESDKPVEVINSRTTDKTGVINFGYDNSDFKAKYVFNMGKTASEYAANIFYALREFDDSDVEEIYAIPPKDDGVGIAVRNRIYKSAGGKVI